MKCVQRCSSILVALTLLAGCTGSSGGELVADPEPTVTVAPTTDDVIDEPTATAEPAEPVELSDQVMIDAAIAAFDANPEPAELIAWDHLDATVSGGEVTLRLCSWSGDSVFDEVRLTNYIVTPDDNGGPTTRLNFSNPLFGEDCQNTELLESALAFTREYDNYWRGVLEDPTTFDPAEAAEIKTPELVATNAEAVAGWVRDGLHWEGLELDGDLPKSAVNHVLGRQYDVDGAETFELIGCRNMDPRYGLYRDDELIDDAKEGPVNDNSISIYQLTRRENQWVLTGILTNVWGDCINTQPSWLEGVDEWMPEPGPWHIVVDYE